MKRSYVNIIILSVLIIISGVFCVVKFVNFDELLLKLGYYDKKISVAQTADIHGHIVFDEDVGGYFSIDEVNTIMGMPTLKHFADETREKNKDMLFLDSGDMFHGTNEGNIERGKAVVEVANEMGYDAMTVGNHEFDWGFDRLKEIESLLKFPMLCANVYKDGKPAFQEYKIVEVGGKKIGLIGMAPTNALMFANSRDNFGVTIEDPIKIASRIVPIVRKQVDVVILISHLGDFLDEPLIKQVDGIDLVLCGHMHNLYTGAKKVNNTYMVEPGGYSSHLGIADIYFKNGKVAKITWTLKTTTDKSMADKTVDAVAQKYHEIAFEQMKDIVGKVDYKLDGMRTHVRGRETDLANLLTDAMKEVGNADIALMNGGGIRESISAGPITLYKIGNTLPFVNSLVTVEVSGDKIYSAVEHGLNAYPNSGNGAGGFLQVSGINYVFDGSKLAGERLVSITRDGKPLDKNKMYKVALNDFLYNGGDDYKQFLDAKLLSRNELLKDVLANYIKKKGGVIAPKVEGRITVTNERYK